MRSERQIQASRANGAKSRGPVTPEGKRASSKNAIAHGMLADTIVLECESRDRFLALLASYHEELQPQTPIENDLIETMAVAKWRQKRLWSMERAGMDHEIRRQAELGDSNEKSSTRAALAFRTLSDDSRSLDVIHRYDARYDRQYLRARRCFMEMRDRRTPPESVFAKRTQDSGPDDRPGQPQATATGQQTQDSGPDDQPGPIPIPFTLPDGSTRGDSRVCSDAQRTRLLAPGLIPTTDQSQTTASGPRTQKRVRP